MSIIIGKSSAEMCLLRTLHYVSERATRARSCIQTRSYKCNATHNKIKVKKLECVCLIAPASRPGAIGCYEI